MSLLFCFAASDTTKSKAPKEETPSLEKTNLVMQSAQLPIPGYTSQQSQQAASFGLGTRLKEAWKSALPAKQSVQCLGCYKETPISKMVNAPCGHIYCPICIIRMARLAVKNKALFPVRCCGQEIPSHEVISALASSRERHRYQSRKNEYAVPPADRWYCPQTHCRQWIPLTSFVPSKPLKCPHCRAKICLNCRDLAHSSRECAVDDSLDEVLELARRQHWQRCYNCHTLVERIDGCRHIECVCGAEFCYHCSEEWGMCHEGCRWNFEEVPVTAHLGDVDLDITTLVAAMELAEREEEAILRHNRSYRSV